MFAWAKLGESIGRKVLLVRSRRFSRVRTRNGRLVRSCSGMVCLCHGVPARRCKRGTALCYHRVDQRPSPALHPRLPQTPWSPTPMARRSSRSIHSVTAAENRHRAGRQIRVTAGAFLPRIPRMAGVPATATALVKSPSGWLGTGVKRRCMQISTCSFTPGRGWFMQQEY